MSKAKQGTVKATPETINHNGTATASRTRAAAKDGIGTAPQQLRVLNAIAQDHADEAAAIDYSLLLRSIGKVQGLVALSIRAAGEARRNPQFKSNFFLSA